MFQPGGGLPQPEVDIRPFRKQKDAKFWIDEKCWTGKNTVLVFAETEKEAMELTNQSGIGLSYPLDIWACGLSQEQCLEYLNHTPGCRTRERTYVDEFHYNALLIIFYGKEKYGPSTLDELRFFTQEIHKQSLARLS